MDSSSPTPFPFAFVQIKDAVCLVQLTNPSMSPLMYSDVRIFRHEFITIFRYSHCASVHPSDIHVLEVLDDRSTSYEEEQETVCLAREVMARMQRLSRIGLGGAMSSTASQQKQHYQYTKTATAPAHGTRMQSPRTSRRVAPIH
ncbi:hypothetical protein BXZ70DRAFT_1006902 [Cristinia sonorae]|uniref:Uncharacterized protein n=1 Tax=Cristinia sonorae TaxID=1940300 RepID=A0A8K0XR85_9AGAR|nr:hypothetical protein BXZ70DRAFT_1006902 [Cristinia sonorae]